MQEHRSPLTLFIIKKFQANGGYDQGSNSLKIATTFVVDMLLLEGHRAALVEALNQNDIEPFIKELNPSIVILEALWVTPAKMAELRKLFPKLKIVVRVNSEIPFLTSEGIGIQWIAAFMKLGVDVAFNSSQAQDDFKVLGDSIYLPNYYPMRRLRHTLQPSRHLRVGCFGAMRILKNQVEQAFAAVRWAKHIGKPLIFHMNDSPDGQDANAIKKSIKAVIEGTGNTLVLHPWMDHEDFLNLIASMDLCLQVSFSESFNITASDAVSMGVPLVGSSAVRWLPKRSQAETGSTKSIVDAIRLADHAGVALNHVFLEQYVIRSVILWNEFVEGCHV
jgi:hypothetical protein